MDRPVCIYSPSILHQTHGPNLPIDHCNDKCFQQNYETKHTNKRIKKNPKIFEVGTTKRNTVKSSYEAASDILVKSMNQQQKAT